jgi:putative ABC transport system ATP-binding protein
MNTTSPRLECIEVSRHTPPPDSHAILRNISFRISIGEILAVTGPSGAGKSTLLRLLNRLEEPTSGTIRLDGEDTCALAPAELRRRIGFVMQRPFLFPGSVGENIAFGPAQHEIHLAPDAIESMLEEVGLPDYASRATDTLSGGEAQRVALLRTLANQPELLLLDEPTSALDTANRQSVEDLILRLIRERNLTCIWVTHRPEQARLADRVLHLEAGQAVALGTPQEVLP